MGPDPKAMLAVVPALLLGLGAAFAFDRMCLARGLQPPGFRILWRRVLSGLVLACVLALGVFGPVSILSLGGKPEPDFSQVSTPQLFGLHFLLLVTMGIWFLLGFAVRRQPEWPATPPAEPPAVEPAAPPPVPLGRQLLAQLGLLAPSVPREIGVGLVLGIGAWLAVLALLVGIGLALWALGGESLLPKQPPAMVPFIAGLPLGVKVAVSLSAGLVEEGFFRGFLQPRIGIPLSTAFFALAHLSYGQPFMLVGITVLSLIYAFLVRWRQNLWPAIAAHALFDGVQLLVVVPAALRMIQGAGA
jgi:membrane protease YdiL (CAAX protease family)